MKEITKDLKDLEKRIRFNILTSDFVSACANGNLENVIKIYNKSYLEKKNLKSKILSILKISDNIILDPHFSNDTPIDVACMYGHKEVVNFLLNDKYFINSLNKNNLSEKVMALVKLKKNDIVKIFIEKIDMDQYFEYNGENLPLMLHLFIEFCNSQNLDMLKSFNTEKIKECIEKNSTNQNIKIDNKDIIDYLLFTIDIAKYENFTKNIDSPELNLLLAKKAIYNELKNEIILSDDDIKPNKNKKLKL